MTEDFGDAPRLGDAAHRPVRRFRLEDFADRPKPGVRQMRLKRLDHSPDRLSITVDAEVRVEVRSQEPGPRHAHVIRRVAGTLVALVDRLIARVIRSQGSKTVWREELCR